ncbi:MAG: fatty acid desaturase family protein [Acidobacteriota bacterium]|nr:fatty acid desaturase family protein [Acidobacteriota bacterium]
MTEPPSPTARPLPAHDDLAPSQRLFSVLSIAAAALLLCALGARLAAQLDLWQWWVPMAFVLGLAAADFGSGLVHWSADTWGRDDLPIIGTRLLKPFRLHHINPDDFLSRRFIDTNGDTAFVAVPLIALLLLIPIDTTWGGAVAVAGFGFCGIGMMTNQIHQWAHMPDPPRPVRVLQACGLILGRVEHAAHHAGAYDAHYCITTGWCNRPLEALGAFRRFEAAVTRVTGLQPRDDDRRYEERYGPSLQA